MKNSLHIQYKIELQASGMAEGPAARGLTVPEKLQRLRAYQASARESTFKELPFTPTLVGHFWRPRSSVTTLVSQIYEGDGLRVYVQQMPSAMRGIEERHWCLKLEAYHGLLAVDASQDLILVEKNDPGVNSSTLYFLSLSTGDPHPLAFVDSGRKLHKRANVEVFGDYCAAACWGPKRPCLTAWNWKTQSTDVNIYPPQPGPLFNFTFLDRSHIAVIARDILGILVYSLDPQQRKYRPTTFKLPHDINVGHTPTLASSTGVAGVDHPGIFHPGPSMRMLSLTFIAPPDDDEFVLNIPVDTLLARLRHRPAKVPWADWGPAGSRLAPRLLARPIVRSGLGSGMSMVMPAPDGRVAPDGAHFVVLSHFHPLRVAQARLRSASGLVEDATDTCPESLGGLHSATLPYVVEEFTMPWRGDRVDRPHKVIICEDQLFVIEESEDEDRIRLVKAWACTI
ncbi:hypothetical protein FA95DRAFT_1611158 [Auriscalpium vulgare]|uniref:Uncharacterized protein n=1 Tax=Auriscalpium vulgare TaxID=40419 RepID=A0ACB8RBB2_9AGAM|nr:hypothetical protein FA95DRAFT_1611158 [Auriscalpium vulgare]